MGLDITAGSKIVFMEATDDYELFDEKYYTDELARYVSLYPEPNFPGREAPLEFQGKKLAIYRVDGDLMGFRAGSYSGYNAWREQLSLLANGMAPRQIWEQHDDPAIQALPFFPLICFSDCEGVIGSVAAQRLAADFAAFQQRAEHQEDTWFIEKYREWRRACELASDNGFIEFH